MPNLGWPSASSFCEKRRSAGKLDPRQAHAVAHVQPREVPESTCSRGARTLNSAPVCAAGPAAWRCASRCGRTHTPVRRVSKCRSATAGGPRLAGAVFPSAERGRERKRTRCSSAVSSATWALRRSTLDIAVGGEGLGGGEKGGGGAEQLRSWDSVLSSCAVPRPTLATRGNPRPLGASAFLPRPHADEGARGSSPGRRGTQPRSGGFSGDPCRYSGSWYGRLRSVRSQGAAARAT